MRRPPRKPCAICGVLVEAKVLDDEGRCQSCAGQLELPIPK